MKKTLLLMVLVAIFNVPTFSQFVDNAPCTSGNPNGSSFFDWTQQYFTIHTNALGSTTIQSPYFLTSLNNPNVNELSLSSNKDFNSAEGWELWKHDFGTTTARTDVPYFILYNRHTGLMRVFIAFANLLGQNNAISIVLKYKDATYRSAILENYVNDQGRNATQNFSNNVPPTANSNYYLNSNLTWYHSDFYLHFDPCICNYKTSLVLEVKLSNNGTFNFTIDGQAIQNFSGGQGTDANGRIGEKGVLSSFLDLNNQPYKSTGFFRDLYSGATLGQNIMNAKWNTLDQKIKDGFLQIFNGFAQGIPIVSAFANFLTTIFDKNNGAQPMRPLVFDINLKGQGNISYTYNYSFNQLVVPGSEQTLLSTTILPYYNKPVGVFTLLTEPTIEYVEEFRYTDEWTPEFHETDIQKVYKLKDEVINYTVNPHAGFDLSQSIIKGQIVFIGSNGEMSETPLFSLGCIKDAIRYFNFHSSYSPDGDPYYNWEYGWVPYKALLKIVANFKVAGTSLDVPYVATYNLKSVQNYNLVHNYQDQDPLQSCSLGYTTSDANTIKSICNSTQYKDKVTEYYRIERERSDDTLQNDMRITVYPNPVKNKIHISMPQNKNPNKFNVKIYSVSGQLVYKRSHQVPSTALTIENLTSLKSGLYYLVIDSEKKNIFTTNFIKE